jgi:4-hydroxy-4-methyl-2-oxoglutarate aldolase
MLHKTKEQEAQEVEGGPPVGIVSPPRLDPSLIDSYYSLADTSSISDILDAVGINGAVSAAVLQPTIDGAKVVGQAVTLRNAPEQETLPRVAERGSRMAYFHDLARPGDVLVIESVPGCSNFGGIAAFLAKQAGEAGAVVDGGVRDIGDSRSLPFPIWARERTPISGKYRVRTVEVNGLVTIADVEVNPGDLVVADETGVCFIPFEHAEDVLVRVRALAAREAEMRAQISQGEVPRTESAGHGA